MRYLVAPLMNAVQKEANEQVAGAESSAQVPMTKLFNREVFWVMCKDELDLNINNPEAPKILCVANHESIKKTLSPCISVIAQMIKMTMNDQPVCHPCLYSIDELPTLFILDLDEAPNEMRSKKVLFLIGYQLDSQIDDDYGDKKAKRLKTATQNVFIGSSSDIDDAERSAKMFGEDEVVKVSYNHNESGVSRTESLQKEKVFQARDIIGQPTGHFLGRIAGGIPPYFSTQLADGSIHKILGVKEDEIPDIPFNSMPIKTSNTELGQKVLSELMDRNFERIISEVEELLKPFSIPSKKKTNPVKA